MADNIIFPREATVVILDFVGTVCMPASWVWTAIFARGIVLGVFMAFQVFGGHKGFVATRAFGRPSVI